MSKNQWKNVVKSIELYLLVAVITCCLFSSISLSAATEIGGASLALPVSFDEALSGFQQMWKQIIDGKPGVVKDQILSGYCDRIGLTYYTAAELEHVDRLNHIPSSLGAYTLKAYYEKSSRVSFIYTSDVVSSSPYINNSVICIQPLGFIPTEYKKIYNIADNPEHDDLSTLFFRNNTRAFGVICHYESQYFIFYFGRIIPCETLQSINALSPAQIIGTDTVENMLNLLSYDDIIAFCMSYALHAGN